jgi:TRAP-type C4-dicarboxylate transport system permease small subunit
MELFKKLGKILDRILDFFSFLVCAIIVVITLAVCVNVIMRYVFNRPIIGVEEITEQLLLFITFLGTAWLLKNEGHVTVDFVVIKLSPRTQAVLSIISSLFGVLISLALTWYGTKVTWSNFVKGAYFSTILELPKAPFFAVIPLGSFFLLVQFLRRIVNTIQKMGPGTSKQITF